MHTQYNTTHQRQGQEQMILNNSQFFYLKNKELTESKESSDTETELRLLLSSLPNIKERTIPDPCLCDNGMWRFDARPRKDDCSPI